MKGNCKQGEIWFANLNPNYGTELGKVRPVVIVQNDDLNEFHLSTIICPITSRTLEKENTLRVSLTKRESGLDKPSDIVLDQIRAIDKSRLRRRVGKMPQGAFVELQAKLKNILDLE